MSTGRLVPRALLRIFALLALLALVAGGVFYWNPLWVNDEHTRYNLWRSHVRSETVVVGGSRIHYFEALPPGGSPGKPLLLIHGLGARAEDWSPMIPTLAASGFHVYALDLLGYGRSSKPDVAYSISLEEAAVAGFMRAVGLPRADVDGWSMGGWIAAKLALDHPEMVDRLVLDDSAGVTYKPSFERDAFVPTDSTGVAKLIALLTPKPRALPEFVMRAALRRIAREGSIIQQSMDSMLTGRDLLDGRLRSIRQPTLIVWGTEDTLIPIAVGNTMHKEIAQSVFLEIAGCGHLAPGDCSKPVLAGTIQFLQAQPPMQGGDFSLPGTAEAGAHPPSSAELQAPPQPR